jgi:hypothetical protein
VIIAVAAACGARGNAVAPVPAPAGQKGCSYDVAVGQGARELVIDARLGAGGTDALHVDPAVVPYLRDVEVEEKDDWREAPKDDHGWTVPGCGARGCRVRYRFLLADAAAALYDLDEAEDIGGAFESPPSAWLLRASDVAAGTPYRFHVTTAGDARFVTGVFAAADDARAFAGDASAIDDAPFSAFGPLVLHELAGGKVTLALAPGPRALSDDAIASWVSTAARAVDAYYARPPVPHLLVIAVPRGGSHVGDARTEGGGGASIFIEVGQAATQAALEEDWELTHEMVHTALPSLARRYHWLEEGLATYVEPIARARLGLLTPEYVWRETVQGMPQGLPQAGDEGLDRTPTWGRTYWGGALFCLLADVAIRERTNGARSLDDALRAIVAAGGNIAERWDLDRVLDVGDAAVGVPVLRELHDRMGEKPEPVDLGALWAKLGVAVRGDDVVFDDHAPLASVRRRITARAE